MCVDPAEAELASRQLAQGQYVCIPQCGHAPQMEKPKLINRLVVDFLTSPTPVPRRQLNEMMLAKSVPVPG